MRCSTGLVGPLQVQVVVTDSSQTPPPPTPGLRPSTKPVESFRTLPILRAGDADPREHGGKPRSAPLGASRRWAGELGAPGEPRPRCGPPHRELRPPGRSREEGLREPWAGPPSCWHGAPFAGTSLCPLAPAGPRAHGDPTARRQPWPAAPAPGRAAHHAAKRCPPAPRPRGHWSTARDPSAPIGCGGRSRERGSGMASPAGRGAGKLKGAARRRGARVRARPREERAACPRAPTAASGRRGRAPAALSPGPAVAAAPSPPPRGCCRGPARRHFQLLSCTRYVGPRCGQRTRGEGRAGDAFLASCHLHLHCPACSHAPGVNSLDGLEEAVAPRWDVPPGNQRWDGAGPEPRVHPGASSPGADIPGGCHRSRAVGDQEEEPRLPPPHPPPGFPVVREETHLGASRAAERDGTRSPPRCAAPGTVPGHDPRPRQDPRVTIPAPAGYPGHDPRPRARSPVTIPAPGRIPRVTIPAPGRVPRSPSPPPAGSPGHDPRPRQGPRSRSPPPAGSPGHDPRPRQDPRSRSPPRQDPRSRSPPPAGSPVTIPAPGRVPRSRSPPPGRIPGHDPRPRAGSPVTIPAPGQDPRSRSPPRQDPRSRSPPPGRIPGHDPRPRQGLPRACGAEAAARGRSRRAAPTGVAPPPRPGVITRAPPPRRPPPPAGHISGNPARALPPGHTTLT
ncbi:basic proline-rich protein-like [Canis lupus familiaris]|uniref:basic proline-rich protein-like n=1 Tax=Canis lupus familiaris TaxID=9615 RepID=UPI0018F5BC78|nr:basic proline-rich protein-like [Canis lupus familiaris]